MDWARAIAKNREDLLVIVAGLLALAGIGGGAAPAVLRRSLRNHLYRLLRPAESAARRLIVMAARSVEAKPSPSSAPASLTHLLPRGEKEERTPSLPLFDPLKRFDAGPKYAKTFPRITFVGVTEPAPLPEHFLPTPDDMIDARPLCRRLAALQRALGDIDGQAQRLARRRARRDGGRTRRLNPLRPGRPPGYRKRPVHPVDEVLGECHALALLALNPPDS